MDVRWILDSPDDGAPEAQAGPVGVVWVFRARWVHDCLEVRPHARTLSFKAQPDSDDDDPAEWEPVAYNVRRGSSGWEVWIGEEEWRGWIDAEEAGLRACEELAKLNPDHAWVERKQRARLGMLREVGSGWVPFANDVSQLLDSLL